MTSDERLNTLLDVLQILGWDKVRVVSDHLEVTVQADNGPSTVARVIPESAGTLRTWSVLAGKDSVGNLSADAVDRALAAVKRSLDEAADATTIASFDCEFTTETMRLIEQLASQQGFSRRKLAEASGVPRMTLNRIWTGEQPPKLIEIEALLRVLGYEPKIVIQPLS